ncbi:MAG TPA: response regulator transcription factor [Candidatus Polarisedimenticolaceae bacterium]|nr:response regulator transcription factor [Candidatus Polarisedimenticolaceae bacterium]
MTPRLLVVEDEVDIAELLRHVLTKEGFQVGVAHDGLTALEAIGRERFDLIVLDWMLPELSGIDVLKEVRGRDETRMTPVILLTARREEIDRVLGLELGADDYVTKPFSTRELVLRARGLLKRGEPREEKGGAPLRVGPIEISTEDHRALVEGKPMTLTVTEFRLLEDLVRAKGRVRTRETLLSEVWGYDSEVLSRTVDTHVRRLRTKLGIAADWLVTVRGIGYRIQAPE